MSKTALVTGGSSGIGRAICHALARRKYKVFITGRNEDHFKTVVSEVEAHGGQATFGTGDVSSEDDVLKLHTQAKAYFGDAEPDVLVANAGVGRFGAIEDMTLADFDLSMNTNVRGVFLWLRACIPGMKAADKGQIVVMSSVAGLRKYKNASTYCATKWALQGMVGAVRVELEQCKVKIATINPGGVATPWWTEYDRGGKQAAATEDKLKTLLTADDVADATMTVVDQAASCDIEALSLDPGSWEDK